MENMTTQTIDERRDERLEQNFAQLLEMLEQKKLKELKEWLKDQNEVDIAYFLERMPNAQTAVVFRMLSKEDAAAVFTYFNIDQKEHIIGSITDSEISDIMEEMFLDDTVDMMEELPSNVVKRIMKSAKPGLREQINLFLQYPADSAGAIMTAEFIDIKKDMDVSESLERVRRLGRDTETIYTLFVISADRKLEGVITIKDLILAESGEKVSDIMDENVIYAVTTDDREKVADVFAKYDMINIPVVDSENRLVGIITVDDIIDVIKEEAAEDMEKMAAISPTDRPYTKTGIFSIVKARIPWLILLMLTAIVTGGIIEMYEDAIAAHVVLAAAIPMLMDTAGNAGSQSSVTIIRAMSLNEVGFASLLKIVWKESRVAIICGVIMAAVNYGRMLLFGTSAAVSFVVSLTLFLTVVIAKMIGSAIPLLAAKVKLDPAVLSGAVVTTIADILALLVYFQIASWLLGI